MTPRILASPHAKWLLLPPILAAIFGVYYLIETRELFRYTNYVVYLTRYASIVTPGGGVYGFAPGTKFTVDPMNRSVPDKVFVSDGTHQMAIEPEALTHDPDRARSLAASDQRGQTLSAAALTAEKLHLLKAERDAQMNRAHDIEMLNARQHPGTIPATPIPTPPRIQPPVR